MNIETRCEYLYAMADCFRSHGLNAGHEARKVRQDTSLSPGTREAIAAMHEAHMATFYDQADAVEAETKRVWRSQVDAEDAA
jgi:hypothetical protein